MNHLRKGCSNNERPRPYLRTGQRKSNSLCSWVVGLSFKAVSSRKNIYEPMSLNKAIGKYPSPCDNAYVGLAQSCMRVSEGLPQVSAINHSYEIASLLHNLDHADDIIS